MAARTSRQSEQMARREALSLVSSKRAERVAREKRLDRLAIAVTAALVQRREIDRTIGAGLVEMTEGEGLQLRDAIEWCGLLSLQEGRGFTLPPLPSVTDPLIADSSGFDGNALEPPVGLVRRAPAIGLRLLDIEPVT